MEYLEKGLIGFSILFFLFQAFNRLKGDYQEGEIVKASLLGIIIALFFRFLGEEYQLGPILALAALVLVVYFFSKFSSWRFWEVLEAVTLPGLVSLLIVQVNRIEAIVYLLTIGTNVFWKNYRNFFWYPSGRVGFLFLANLGTLSFFHLILDFWQRRLLKLGVWSIALLISLIGLALLSGRKKEPRPEIT